MSIEFEARQKCVVVSVEAPWPAVTGGRARTANIASQLAVTYDVTVIYPAGAEDPVPTVPEGVFLRPVVAAMKPKLTDRLSILPRLGKMTLRAIGTDLKRALAELEPEFVYWSHSYLASAGMKTSAKVMNLVEFANIEGERALSISRSSQKFKNKVSALAEYIKSIWWEPRCARQASMTVSLNHSDASILRRYGATVVLVPNGFSQHEYTRSPNGSRRILAMASWTYEPNRTGLESFLRNEWDEIVRRNPQLELVIVGKGAHQLLSGRVSGVRNTLVLGFVDDLSQVFNDCFCFLAPAVTGGGSQLKIADALSHHRLVVGPKFLQRELTPEMPSNTVIPTDDLVTIVTDLARFPERRHVLEDQLRAFVADRTWQKNFAPVHDWLAEAVSMSSARKN